MAIAARIRDVFGYFEYLNLLILLEDLRSEGAARGGWSRGKQLCPIAHGLPTGLLIRELDRLGQTLDLPRGCDQAARHLGADSAAILRFVRLWDDGSVSSNWLLQQLEELWLERLENAQAVQQMIAEAGAETTPGARATSETGR